MTRRRPYKEELIQALKNPAEAVAYLNGAVEECLKGDSESREMLLLALRNVREAQGLYSRKKKGTSRKS
jgi:hypothetical protein